MKTKYLLRTASIILLLLTWIVFPASAQMIRKDSCTKVGKTYKLAETPPMGWNSYNCFGAAVKEEEIRANADYMAKYLKQYGWEYVVVDYCWFYPHPPGSIQNNPPQFRLPKDSAYVPWLPMDEYGRLLPDIGKFPSSKDGNGFKPLADYIHSLGLKFGIHAMRGIPRQSVWAKSSILGVTGLNASDIADTTSFCSWLNTMWGVDLEKEGSQEYYNSVINLYASWGVDFIKLDDALNQPYHEKEIEAVAKAIANCGRPIVLSLSPSINNIDKAFHVQKNSNMWRISEDFWDDWKALKAQFELAKKWNGSRTLGHWPDLDMLQLGKISRRGPSGPERYSRFTQAEKQTHFTLWAIYKSPLMFGGDLTQNRGIENQLIMNPEIIAVNQIGQNPRLLKNENGLIVWISDSPKKNEKFLAFFNLSDVGIQKANFQFKELGLLNNCLLRDLWSQTDMGRFNNEYSLAIPPHGSVLLSITSL